MVTFPPCKINLGLNIIGKRTDGYHNIVTCFYPVPWEDMLEIIPAKVFSFSQSGETVPGTPEKNLCVAAYNHLRTDFQLPPVIIHLHKTIPIGAGLGGGSADGAYALRILNEIFQLGLSGQLLKKYAARLGSDCPFFIADKPQFGTGRGDVLSDVSLSLKGKYLVIANPGIYISTAEAYQNATPGDAETDLRNALENHPLGQWRSLIRNDFEEPLFTKFPVLMEFREKLYRAGASYAGMSGSGSSVFGIFGNKPGINNDLKNIISWSGYLN